MKPFMKSRLGRSLIAIVVTFLTLALRRYMPAEIAEVLSVELVSSLGAAIGLGAVGLRVQDRRRVVTAGQLLDRKAAKAAAKLSALLLLSGCSAFTAAVAPEPVTCPVRARLECAVEPPTAITFCSVYCGWRTIWRQACPSPLVLGGRLYCGEVAVLALPGSVSEVAQ